MAVTRVTQNMMSRHSLASLQVGLNRMAKLQEQLSTGRVLNRPSDNPADAASAMRLRGTVSAVQQYQRNAQDGLSWLGLTDATLGSVTDQVRMARELGLQGANEGALSQTGRNALASTVDQLRASIVSLGNTTHLGRPIFGGVTAGTTAFAADGSYVGMPGVVERTVGDDVRVRVDTDGAAAFGAAGDNVFTHLTALADALRAGDTAAIRAATAQVATDLDRLAAARAEAGTRFQRIETAQQARFDDEIRLTTSLSNLENTDLPQVMVDLQMQQTAYQAALASTAKVVQHSLMDFLR